MTWIIFSKLLINGQGIFLFGFIHLFETHFPTFFIECFLSTSEAWKNNYQDAYQKFQDQGCFQELACSIGC